MKAKALPTKTCLECGDLFYKKPSESKKYWDTKKYCSLLCSLKKTAVQKQSFDRELLKGRTPWNKDTKGLSTANGGSFKKGAIPWMKGRPGLRGEANPMWKPKVLRICEVCKKEMSIAPWDSKRRFCGRDCWAIGTRGKGSPVYRGELAVSRLRNRIAQLPEYREWHAFILKRDNYRCVICGTTQTRAAPLEVDHIVRFFVIANEHSIMSTEDARKCADLWDTDNGRTLCRPCHRTTDTYGTKGLKKSFTTTNN